MLEHKDATDLRVACITSGQHLFEVTTLEG
jgi:hypothetical protein